MTHVPAGAVKASVWVGVASCAMPRCSCAREAAVQEGAAETVCQLLAAWTGIFRGSDRFASGTVTVSTPVAKVAFASSPFTS
jgi:hypothetical protein